MRAWKLALAAGLLGFSPTASMAQEAPRLAAVFSTANWCASCRVMEPKIRGARAQTGFEGVRFVTLDYSERDRADYFSQADDAGVGPAVRAHFRGRIGTGMLLLIDLDDAVVVGEVRRGSTVQDLTFEIWRATVDA